MTSVWGARVQRFPKTFRVGGGGRERFSCKVLGAWGDFSIVGQNAAISKQSAAEAVGGSNSVAGSGVTSIWLARAQGFPSILFRDGWEGVIQQQGYVGLGRRKAWVAG